MTLVKYGAALKKKKNNFYLKAFSYRSFKGLENAQRASQVLNNF